MENNLIQKAAATNAVKTASPKRTTQDLMRAMEPEIKKALPSVMTPERFTRIALSALSNSKGLQEASPMSFIAGMMQAAQLGVEPNTPLGQAYLIPYRNHGQMEVQFQLGYKGLIDLAYRSGEVSTIQAHTVYSNDEFVYELGLDPKLKHIPATGDRGEPTHYYAVVRMKDGGYNFAVISKAECIKYAKKYSKTYENGPWQANFDEMAKKTVLKKALKYAPMKSEFTRGMAADETVKTKIDEDMYAIPDESIIDVDQSTGEVIENKE